MKLHGWTGFKERGEADEAARNRYSAPYGRLYTRWPKHRPPGKSDDERMAALEGLGETLVRDGDEAGELPAAYTYLGQFIDHDVTFEVVSSLARFHRVADLENGRSPRLELDSLYGGGPLAQPAAFECRPARGSGSELAGFFFRLGRAEYSASAANAGEMDLPRACRLVALETEGRVALASPPGATIAPDPELRFLQDDRHVYATIGPGLVREANSGIWRQVEPASLLLLGAGALIADPRNDENILVSQLTLAMMRFHNVVTADLLAEADAAQRKPNPLRTFDDARRLVRWHYQHLIVHDYLPRLLGQAEFEHYLAGGPAAMAAALRHYRLAQGAYVPIEFAAAAFRFGHAMIRCCYELNDRRDSLGIQALPILDRTTPPDFDPKGDLRGARMLPDCWSVQWNRFLEFPADRFPGLECPSERVQRAARIGPAIAAPLHELPEVPDGGSRSLAVRDLQRGFRLRLPAGEWLAWRMNLAERRKQGTPLWLYVLREAAAAGGSRLGAVGGTIVAETMLGLLLSDEDSYVRQAPGWKPTYGRDGSFTLADLIYVSGAPIQESELPFADLGGSKPPGKILPQRVSSRHGEVLGPEF